MSRSSGTYRRGETADDGTIRLVQTDEDLLHATCDLDGRIGVFIHTVERLGLSVGARVFLRVRDHDLRCTVVSLTPNTAEVVSWGLYMTLDSDEDARAAAHYFATRQAVFFEGV